MGEVYLAEDAQLRRLVALKILPAGLAGNQDRMRRFVQEAQAAAALNHPASKISDAATWLVKVSTDGHFLALVAFIGQTTQPRVSILKFDDLTPFKILDLPVTPGSDWCFSPDSRAIIYSDTRGATNLWRLPLDGSPARQITDFNADVMSSFAYASDGKQLALSRGSTTRDAVLITEEK